MPALAIPYVKASDAVKPLLAYCQEHALERFFLIADHNTYHALGQRVEEALRQNGMDVRTILLEGEEIVTDAHYIVQTMVETRGESRVYLAVGSGTVTDITRFISHRSHDIFLSLPTAPSVDGFTSIVAPMVVGNYKSPVPAQPPAAVFVDLPTLCAAPRPMIAAGLGDLLGKYTSLADWKIGALLYDEPYDAEIDHQMRQAVDDTIMRVNLIAAGEQEGIVQLMDGLIGSGLGMLAFGDSRPASGSEHHLAHYWEVKRILESRPAVLHGAEVGVGTILSAQRYAFLRKMSRADAASSLQERGLPGHDAMIEEIQAGYGPVTNRIVKIQEPLFRMGQNDLEHLKTRILDRWEDIQGIARRVPEASQIEAWIQAAGGPTTPAEIDLNYDETMLGLRSAHYLRDRFTLNRLGFWLALPFPG